MNKRRRWKAKRRRRRVERVMAIMVLDRPNAESFLRETFRHKPRRIR